MLPKCNILSISQQQVYWGEPTGENLSPYFADCYKITYKVYVTNEEVGTS